MDGRCLLQLLKQNTAENKRTVIFFRNAHRVRLHGFSVVPACGGKNWRWIQGFYATTLSLLRPMEPSRTAKGGLLDLASLLTAIHCMWWTSHCSSGTRKHSDSGGMIDVKVLTDLHAAAPVYTKNSFRQLPFFFYLENKSKLIGSSFCLYVCVSTPINWTSLFETWVYQGDRLCGLVTAVPGYRSRDTGFDSLRYQILRLQPREYNWGAIWMEM
jgi:hypothetical protein